MALPGLLHSRGTRARARKPARASAVDALRAEQNSRGLAYVPLERGHDLPSVGFHDVGEEGDGAGDRLRRQETEDAEHRQSTCEGEGGRNDGMNGGVISRMVKGEHRLECILTVVDLHDESLLLLLLGHVGAHLQRIVERVEQHRMR